MMKRRRILSSFAISLAASAVRGTAQTAADHSANAETAEDLAHRLGISLDRSRLAAEYLRPLRHVDETAESTAALDHDGFKPYRDAARW